MESYFGYRGIPFKYDRNQHMELRYFFAATKATVRLNLCRSLFDDSLRLNFTRFLKFRDQRGFYIVSKFSNFWSGFTQL